MQVDELVIARLDKGTMITRVLEIGDSHVRVVLGRNKQARIPQGRVTLSTGLFASNEEEVEEIRKQAYILSKGIDLVDVWEIITCDEPDPISVHEIASLYCDDPPEAIFLVALVLYLDHLSDHFVYGQAGYTPLSPSALEERRTRRKREMESETAARDLIQALSKGKLPGAMSCAHMKLLDVLRNYAIYGEENSNDMVAKALLKNVKVSKQDLQKYCFELLSKANVVSVDEPLELYRSGVRINFPKDILSEIHTIDLRSVLNSPLRKNLTEIPTLTIDDAETEDRDDAISVIEEVGNHVKTSNIYVGIHVADIGSLVSMDGHIDQEARRRMATLYLPEGNIPMLPSELVNGFGSLDPGKIRPAVSILARISNSGSVLDWEITPSLIRSQVALSYEDADQAMKDETSLWYRMLTRVDFAASTLRRRREEAGAIKLRRAEMVVKVLGLDSIHVGVRLPTPASELVAELMILYNALLARFCSVENIPAIYRSQKPVNPDYKRIDFGDEKGSLRDPRVLQYLTMRRLSPSNLDMVPTPHASLGVKAYTQVTSPIRRYPDLLMQRQVSYFLNAGGPLYTPRRLESAAQSAGIKLREIAKIEDQRKRYWFLKYLQQYRLGSSSKTGSVDLFPATVLENEGRRKTLLELVEYPFRIKAEVPRRHVPGDIIMLRLRSVDLWTKTVNFNYVDQ